MKDSKTILVAFSMGNSCCGGYEAGEDAAQRPEPPYQPDSLRRPVRYIDFSKLPDKVLPFVKNTAVGQCGVPEEENAPTEAEPVSRPEVENAGEMENRLHGSSVST